MRQTTSLCGLVLAGGKSSRMLQDKGSLVYHDCPQREHVFGIVESLGIPTYLSCRQDQVEEIPKNFPTIGDKWEGKGPIAGILSAFDFKPDIAWLVVACDMPFLRRKTIQHLIDHRDPNKDMTVVYNTKMGQIEPLLGIWEPKAGTILKERFAEGTFGLKRIIKELDLASFIVEEEIELRNVNDPDEYAAALSFIRENEWKV